MADHSYTAMTQIGDEKLDKESFAPAPKAAPEDTPHVKMTFISNIMSTPDKNIIVQSPKGSGKSTGVVTAMVHRVDPELKNPQAICIVPNKESAIQYKVDVPDEPSKVMVLNKLLDFIAESGQAIIFVHTIDRARMLFEILEANRLMFKTLDGADTQEERDKILEEFKEKRFQVLISTKPLDWGFDPSQVGLVVSYDLSILLGSSSEPELEQDSPIKNFIGRAGQFDRKGVVVNLMCGDMDKKIMEKIETLKNVNEVNTDV